MDTQLTILEQKTHTFVERARTFKVQDNVTRLQAIEYIKGKKALEAEIRGLLDAIIAEIYNAHKKATGDRKKLLDPLDEGERLLKNSVLTYDAEQERIRREEELRLQEIARKAEEERMLREAEALEAEGRADEAEEILSQPIVPPPVIIPTIQPKVQGEATRTTFAFEIVNSEKIRPQFLIPDMAAIQKVVTGLGKNAESVVGGIRVFEKKTMAVRI